MGIETEYGISGPGMSDFNPVLSSSMLINSYAGTLRRIRWDYEQESPLRDARGFEPIQERQPVEEDLGLANVILPNGARYYVDHAHPEYSTPECTTPRGLVAHDKAGERILERSLEAVQHLLGPGQRLAIYKNNTDSKGNSYGCHENYLVDRRTPFSRIVRDLTPFLVTRQIFTGAGKVGSESARDESRKVAYQLSQRADFFEAEVGLETTLKRPIINTRDEPHADPEKYRRLHVIIGDAKKYVKENEPTGENGEVLQWWETILSGIEEDPLSLHRELDWVAKHRLVDAYRERDGLDWKSSKLAMIDLQYHDVRRDRGLYYRLVESGKVERLTAEAELERATMQPPEDTRAYFRGRCIQRYPLSIAAASWDSIIFDTGGDILQRVPTREPLRGTSEHVEAVLEASEDAASLIAAIQR